MKFKKTVGALSALAITVSAFAGMAVTANAAETILNNDCSTTDGWAAGSQATVSTESNSEETYVSCYGSGSGNRTAEYTFPENVTSITDGTTTLSFDFYFNENYGNKGVAMLSIGDMWSLTSTQWSSSRNDTYYTSDDPDTLLTVSRMQWYTVTATIDMDNDVAAVVVKQRGTDNILCSSENISFAGGLSTLTVQSPRYDSGTRKTYIDNIIVSHEADKALAKDVVIQYKDGDSVIKTITNELSGLFVGDDYTYYYPAYIEQDGILYKADSETFSATTKLDAVSSTVSVNYSQIGNGQVVEFENAASGTKTENARYSNGSAVRAFADTEVMTVAKSGWYKITVVAGCDRSGGGTRSLSVYQNNVQSAALLSDDFQWSYYENKVINSDAVYLSENDKLIVSADGHVFADYIMITETDDPTPPQPVAPGAVAATHSQDFTTNGDCASLWTATLTGVEGLSFDGIKVTAKNSNGEERENSASTTVITGESSIAVYIAVNLAKDTPNSEGVTVTDVDAQLIDIQ